MTRTTAIKHPGVFSFGYKNIPQMEAIEEMNSIMQELAKLDTQLGVQELEEDENKEEGEEISLIVEQNDAKEPEDDMEDDDKDENVQKFKRIR